MQKNISIIFILFFNFSFAQIIFENFESKFMNENRELKIQLPRNYELNIEKKYPLIIVFDGDYMFEPVMGSAEYLSYWGNIPESIIVGVNQTNSRYEDCSVLDNIDFVPIASSANFYEFISQELIPHFDKNYRTTKFKVAIGQESTANYINYFLINKQTLFSGFISVSPKFSFDMEKYLIKRFEKIKTNIIYFLASSKRDFKSIKQRTYSLSENLNSLDNEFVSFKFKQYEDLTHFNLPIYSLSEGIEYIFSNYSPINAVEYDNVISELETSPVKYLENKYEKIFEIYGLEKDILVSDFRAIEKFIEKSENFNYYKDLSKLADNNHPNTILASYYMGLFYENNGDMKKAVNVYRSAYTLLDIDGITKDELLDRADLISDEINY